MKNSLQRRLILVASLLLAAFLGLTAVSLDRAFRDSAEHGLRDRLQAHLFVLLATAELDPAGHLAMPEMLPESRFSSPGAGLYGQISDVDGEPLWRSGSMLSVEVPFPAKPHVSQMLFGETATDGGRRLLGLSFGVLWEDSDGTVRPYTFSVAIARDELAGQVVAFRRTLWGGLGAMALLLLAAQVVMLRWSLRPLRRVAEELAAIEAGDATALGSGYPTELAVLTSRINRFIRHEHDRQQRTRNTLGDLAHSLKTPLAVMRSGLESDELAAAHPEFETQIDRIADIIEYQLQRAATSGQRTLAAPVDIPGCIAPLRRTLDKVYRDKGVESSVEIAAEAAFHGDAGDLTELAGNLLDNAYKWCRRRVALRIAPFRGEQDSAAGLLLQVDDDGPGVPPEDEARILSRGGRADESVPGHGLGLAMVCDIATTYGGAVTISRAPLGGARVEVRLPG